MLATGSVPGLGGQRASGPYVLHGSPEAFQTAPDTAFSHGAHESLDCTACHDTSQSHGSLTFTGPEGCSSCHHDRAAYPTCEQCHVPADQIPALSLVRSLDLSTGPVESRTLPFDHGAHGDIGCTDCHDDPEPVRVGPGGECSSCHVDHHQSQSPCASCHTGDLNGAHDSPPEPGTPEPHETCAGAGCHTPQSVELTSWSRQTCLTCHTDQTEHEPSYDDCASCHMIPPLARAVR